MLSTDLEYRGLSRNGATSVGVASSLVLLVNPRRKYAVFVNDSDTDIYLARGPLATLNAGIGPVQPGGSYVINLENMWYGEVSAISSAAAKNLAWSEES